MTDAISRQSVIDMLDETKRIARQNIDGAVLMTFERVFDSLVNITNTLPTIQPEPHWIPCSERLPEKNGEYLCQEKLGFLYVDTWNGEYWDCADLAYGTVIAWMPLPESFKEVA